MTEHSTPAPRKAVQIKKLEWERTCCEDGSVYLNSYTPFGGYKVFFEPGRGWRWGYCFDEYYDEDESGCDDEEAGKALAWENWLERLSGALEPAGRAALSEAGHE